VQLHDGQLRGEFRRAARTDLDPSIAETPGATKSRCAGSSDLDRYRTELRLGLELHSAEGEVFVVNFDDVIAPTPAQQRDHGVGSPTPIVEASADHLKLVFQPFDPEPMVTRPFDGWSRVTTDRATSTGWRSGRM
jgi:hypothetical protein